MAYKYPICDVSHWFCKKARFFATEPFIVFVYAIHSKIRANDQLLNT